MRIRPQELSESERIMTLDALYTAASSLRGRESMKHFLRDLLSESERIMFGRRILIARALLAGKTYDDIVKEFKVGKDTIYRTTKWLDDQLPGYEIAISEMEKEFTKRGKDRAEKRLYATSVLHRLKKKYPLHFLLFPVPKQRK